MQGVRLAEWYDAINDTACAGQKCAMSESRACEAHFCSFPGKTLLHQSMKNEWVSLKIGKNFREKAAYVNLYSADAEKPVKFVKKSLDMQKQLRYNAIV